MQKALYFLLGYTDKTASADSHERMLQLLRTRYPAFDIGYKDTDIPLYENGKPVSDVPSESSAGSYVRKGNYYTRVSDEHLKKVMQHHKVPADMSTFRDYITLHEMSHAAPDLDKLEVPSDFSTPYLETMKLTDKHYDKEKRTEFLVYTLKKSLIDSLRRKEVQKEASLLTLKQLKQESDRGNYSEKQRLFRMLYEQDPDSFEVDSTDKDVTGITHKPTGFRFHIKTVAVPAALSKGQGQ
jgi:hypothetical protein